MKSKKLFFISFIFLGLTGAINAQNTYQKTYGGSNNDEGVSIVATYDDNLAILSTESDSITTWINFLKIDTTGNLIWQKQIKSLSYGLEGFRLKTTPDSGFIIAANYHLNSGGGITNLLLIRLNSIGDTLWTKSYSSPNTLNYNSILSIGEIIITSDGGYAIAGTEYITESFQSYAMYLLKTDSNGSILWSKYFGGVGPTFGYSLKETNDFGFIICGYDYYYGGASNANDYIIKTDSAGNFIYSRAYSDGASDFTAEYIDFTSDGGYIISGWRSLLKIDSLANIIWARSYSLYDCISVKQRGSDFLVLAKNTQNSNEDVYLFDTDSIGNIKWTKRFGGSANDESKDFLIHSNSIYVLGSTRNFSHGLNDIYLIKTDTSGNTSCHQDTFTVTTSILSWLQYSGGNEYSGYITSSSPLTINNFVYPSYDACSCIPPVAGFRRESLCCSDFSDYSTWADSWHWDFGDGDTSNLENVTHLYNNDGTYFVCLTVSNACGIDTYCDSINVSVGINELPKYTIDIFPNPTINSINIKNISITKTFLLQIFNSLGAAVYSEKLCGRNEYNIPLSLSAGFYLLRISDGVQQYHEKLIVK